MVGLEANSCLGHTIDASKIASVSYGETQIIDSSTFFIYRWFGIHMYIYNNLIVNHYLY